MVETRSRHSQAQSETAKSENKRKMNFDKPRPLIRRRSSKRNSFESDFHLIQDSDDDNPFSEDSGNNSGNRIHLNL